jgi:NAD(P)-dependent dehydrogenase (short-subunit alcohol dehydrogenase family)
VINSAFIIFQDKGNNQFYLFGGEDAWFSSPDLRKGWSLTTVLPAELQKLMDANKENAEKVAAEIKAMGGKAWAFQADVSNRDMVYGLADKIKKEIGKVDVLINNAGAGHFDATEILSPEKVEQLIRTLVFAHIELCRLALVAMTAYLVLHELLVRWPWFALRVLVARWLGLEPGQGAHFLLDTATLSVLSHYRGLPALQRWNAPLAPA